MKKVNYFDVHDSDVPPVVYELMFTLVDTEGNDRCYEITPSYFLDYSDDHPGWEDRHNRGPHNCYGNHAEMKKLHENWPPLTQAVNQFIDWLKAQGIDPEEELIVKVWW